MAKYHQSAQSDEQVRDTLLERDRLYAPNQRQLNRRVSAGKITPAAAHNIHQWLVRAALRRNQVSKTRAEQLAGLTANLQPFTAGDASFLRSRGLRPVIA